MKNVIISNGKVLFCGVWEKIKDFFFFIENNVLLVELSNLGVLIFIIYFL